MNKDYNILKRPKNDSPGYYLALISEKTFLRALGITLSVMEAHLGDLCISLNSMYTHICDVFIYGIRMV